MARIALAVLLAAAVAGIDGAAPAAAQTDPNLEALAQAATSGDARTAGREPRKRVQSAAGTDATPKKKGRPAAKPPAPRDVVVRRVDEVEPPRRIDRRVGRLHDKLRDQRALEEEARREAVSPVADYLAIKKELERIGVTFQLAPTAMVQWGRPNGGPAAAQGILSPTLNWDIVDSPLFGQSSVQVSYSYNHYFTGQSGASLSSNLNVLSFINDTPTNSYSFGQLTFTQVLPGNWLQITAGQYQFSLFDGNQYAGNQQQTFANFALSQNATQAYIPTSLGAYVQVNPTDTLSLAAGFQDANNTLGTHIQTRTFGEGPWAWFAYGQWNPVIPGLGTAQYSLLYYDQPAVTAQFGVPAQAAGRGWSFNGVQNLNPSFGLFARFNTASGPTPIFSTSIAGGFVYNQPFGIGTTRDQIGVGLAWNKTNLSAFVGQPVRDHELVAEAYWNFFVINKLLQIGPTFQVVFNPALNTRSSTAEILTLRATGRF